MRFEKNIFAVRLLGAIQIISDPRPPPRVSRINRMTPYPQKCDVIYSKIFLKA